MASIVGVIAAIAYIYAIWRWPELVISLGGTDSARALLIQVGGIILVYFGVFFGVKLLLPRA